MIIIEYKVGSKVTFKNLKRMRERYKYMLHENVEYIVIGIDQQDGCPYIVVNDKVLYTTKTMQKFISLCETSDTIHQHELEELSLKYPYIPKSKATMQLMSQLESENDSRWVDLAIDAALDDKNIPLLKQLSKFKNKKHKGKFKKEMD